MDDDSTKPAEQNTEVQEAHIEAVERERRLQMWLDGMLAGRPPLADSTKQWRQGIPLYHELENLPIDEDDNSQSRKKIPVEESLLKIRQGIRDRRELTGKLPQDISVDECERRSAEMVEVIQADSASGKESTPLHLVFAARYIEGEIDLEQYRSAVLKL